MATKKQLIHRLKFTLKYTYNIPDEIMDEIDFEAYVDPTLTFHENMNILIEHYPVLNSYIRVPEEMRAMDEYDGNEQYYQYLMYLSDMLEAGEPEALDEIRKLGFKNKDEFYEKLYEEGVLERPKPPKFTTLDNFLSDVGIYTEPPEAKPEKELPEGWVTVEFQYYWPMVLVESKIIGPLRKGDIVQGPRKSFERPLKYGYCKVV